MSRTWGPDVLFKTGMVLVLVVAVSLLLLGGGLNNIQVKYSKFHDAHVCAHGIFVKEIEDSQFCCDDNYHDSDWACAAAYDYFNKKFTSYLAWVIPLFPFLCTVLADTWHGSLFVAKDRSAYNLVGVHARRLVLYVVLFIFRTIILYSVGGLLETMLQQHSADMRECWYMGLTDDGKCKKEFDYSDHLVLFMTHFLVISVLEVTYVLHNSNLEPFRKYTASMFSAAVIFALTCRTLLFTGMFFHTIYENLMAMGIFVTLILLPLFFFAKTRLFHSMFY